MRLYFEAGTKQMRKRGEELCGDSVEVAKHLRSVTVTLSDGLGSGVKANILATLTTAIIMRMLEDDLPLGEVVQTLGETLPVCNVRKLAYSTFAIAQFFTHGEARIVQFDSPAVILLRDRKVRKIDFEEREIEGKTIHEGVLHLQEGDWVVFVSDGVLNAGIGGIHPLGWGWDQAAGFLAKKAHHDISAETLAEKMLETVGELYAGNPGDDVSIAVVKVRHKLVATILTGPPEDRSKDSEVARRLASVAGRKAVCGGTTAKIVSRHLGTPLEVDLGSMTSEVPPMARIEGVDFVSEGILTLTRVNEMLSSGTAREAIRYRTDGAAGLMRLMLDVDHIHFIVGTAVNPAHQNPDLPHELGIRVGIVREIAEELKHRDKEVTVETV